MVAFYGAIPTTLVQTGSAITLQIRKGNFCLFVCLNQIARGKLDFRCNLLYERSKGFLRPRAKLFIATASNEAADFVKSHRTTSADILNKRRAHHAAFTVEMFVFYDSGVRRGARDPNRIPGILKNAAPSFGS